MSEEKLTIKDFKIGQRVRRLFCGGSWEGTVTKVLTASLHITQASGFLSKVERRQFSYLKILSQPEPAPVFVR